MTTVNAPPKPERDSGYRFCSELRIERSHQ